MPEGNFWLPLGNDMTTSSLDWSIRFHLKLRHLQLLVALDDFRNVGKVATYLHVSQPAISKSLSELEKNMGLKLFQRTAHGMTPTIYGTSLVNYAKKVLTELGKVRDEIHSLSSGVRGKVTVGALPAAALATLPQCIARLKDNSPEIAIEIIEGTMDHLKPRLREGEIEIIIGLISSQLKANDMETILLYEDPMVLATGSHHPLAERKRIKWHELQDIPWILPPHSSIVREPIEQEFRRQNMTLPIDYIESISTMTNIGILQHGNSVAFLPFEVAGYYASLGIISILPLTIPNLLRPIGIMHLKGQSLSTSALMLINTLKTIYIEEKNAALTHQYQGITSGINQTLARDNIPDY